MKFFVSLLFLALSSWGACTKITYPTDYSTVSSGTRANLKANFDAIKTVDDPCKDSTDEIRARFTGYSTSLRISSLEHLMLRLDTDGSTTGLFGLLVGSTGDTILRASEDLSWRFFGAGVGTKLTLSDSILAATARISGNETIGGTLGVTGTSSLTGAVTMGAYSSGRVPVFGTAGLVGQDNLYWDATNDRLGLGSGAAAPNGDFEIIKPATGATADFSVQNSASSGASFARIYAQVQSASTGDPYFLSNISGGGAWAFGGDNSDGDAFVLTNASTLGSVPNSQRWTSSGSSIPGTLGVGGDFAQSSGTHTVTVTDNTTNAVDIQEGANNYINVNTTNSSERVSLGNTTTNPSFDFLGSGTTTHSGAIAGTSASFSSAVTASQLTLGGGSALNYFTTGSFTGALTGCTAGVNVTVYYQRIGNQVTLSFTGSSGTSNSTAMTMTGLPAALQTTFGLIYCPIALTDNGTIYLFSNDNAVRLTSGSGTLTFLRNGSTTGFTSAGAKGIESQTLTYLIQ